MPGTADVAADLGFATFTATNANTGTYQITAFHQTQPHQGMPYTSESRSSGGALISKVDSVYDSVGPNTGTTLVRLTSETNTAYNLGTPSFSRTKSITYDSYGNQTQISESGGGSPTLTTTTSYKTDTVNWDLDKPLQVTVASGGTTLKQKTLTYSGANVTQSCDWIGVSGSACTSFGHDSSGNITSITDPLGNTTTMTYDSTYNSQVASITNELGHAVSKSYNVDGTVAAETDANGNVSSYSYDTFGRLLQTNFANGGHVTENTVSLGDPDAQYKQITTLTDGSRSTVKTQYFDGLGYVYKETTTGDSGIIQVLKTKDSAGRTYSTSQPHYSAGSPDWATNTFDAAGRVTSTTLAGITTTISYGTDSTTTTVNGKSETKTYNALGKIASITDAMSNTTSYSYDALGRVTSVTLPDSSVTTIAYNGLGLKTSITEPNTGTTTFAYDAAGRLTSQTNARGQVVTLTRDVLGRVTEKSFSGGSGTTVTYNYDESGFSNGIGRLTSKTDAGGETQYSYDSMGQIQTKHMVVDSKSYSYTTVYDFAKRPTAITYPDGSVVEYSYTDGGNLSNLDLNGTEYAQWSNYNAQGNPGKVEYGNDTQTDFTYGTLGKLSTLVTEGPNGQLQNLSYTFENALGTNVTAIADNRSNKINPNTSEDTDETVTYTYDNLDRLTQANGVWGTLSYAYNSVGNMTSMEGRSLTYTGQRATSGTDFTATYDASGNNTAQTIDTVSWSYDYDAENRMTRVQKGGNVVANMVYDDAGQRVKKTFNRPDSGQVTTIYIGQGYEVRKRDGIEFHTINLHGNGHLVASITQQGTILTSMGEFNKQLALANLFSSKSILGLISKGAQYFAAAMSHPMATTVIGYAFMILLIGGMLFSFLFSFAKERGWIGQPSEERPVFGMRLRLATLGIAMIFSLTSCGSNGPGGGGLRFWPFGSGIYHVPLANALTGDTLNGLPLGTYFYHKNQINSSSVITNGVGEEASRIIYKPFGTIDHDHSPGINSVTHKFTGQELDEESGLYYYNARYYNSAIGRFVSADSVVPGDGEDPQGFNRYAYVRNNPVKYTDPTGHFWNILAAMMGGVAWAAAGIAGGAAWAAAGAAGGVAWAAAGVAGGAAWAARGAAGAAHATARAARDTVQAASRSARDTLRNADHSARGILENIDHGARRIGETWEMARGNRHKNYEFNAGNILSDVASVLGDIALGMPPILSGLTLFADVGYQSWLSLSGNTPFDINIVAMNALGFLLSDAFDLDIPLTLVVFGWIGGGLANYTRYPERLPTAAEIAKAQYDGIMKRIAKTEWPWP
ncbi:MAG: hypothetical protein K8S54_14690 [Spirochaetia bacterium]|nr:hypothetical protein [Spirochaetia bacterium]